MNWLLQSGNGGNGAFDGLYEYGLAGLVIGVLVWFGWYLTKQARADTLREVNENARLRAEFTEYLKSEGRANVEVQVALKAALENVATEIAQDRRESLARHEALLAAINVSCHHPPTEQRNAAT